MLRGCDISHYNNPRTFNYDGYDFFIIKATEGVTFKDNCMKRHIANAGKKPIGFYHYARPEKNSAAAEAKFFVAAVKDYIGKAVLALDYEGTALKYGSGWAREWLDKVYELTGVKPVIYIQGSVVHKFKPVLAGDYGLWVAHWGVSKPTVQPWPTYALWQYRGSPIDLDYFNGDAETWKKYAESDKKKTLAEIAQEVIDGKWGNGTARKRALENAGYNYRTVQDKVNQMVQ